MEAQPLRQEGNRLYQRQTKKEEIGRLSLGGSFEVISIPLG